MPELPMDRCTVSLTVVVIAMFINTHLGLYGMVEQLALGVHPACLHIPTFLCA
jgi:hypothetical protein